MILTGQWVVTVGSALTDHEQSPQAQINILSEKSSSDVEFHCDDMCSFGSRIIQPSVADGSSAYPGGCYHFSGPEDNKSES